jgi:membrane protein implicated in regulation of membrane protease activity
VQPSSLVFVAIIVGWAAYLLPQWVRRREALSQSRGRDRHSDRVRVLDRRRRTPSGRSSTPILPDVRVDADNLGDAEAEAAAPGRAAGRDPRSLRSPGALAARRRARVLGLLITLVAAGWALTATVPPVGPLAIGLTGLLILDLVALLIAGRRRAVRRATENRRRLREVEQRRRVERARRQAAAKRAAADEPAASAVVEPTGTETAPIATRPERASERVARELDGGADAGTWIPVPVPPPTYTLKPMAPRAEPAPLDLPDAPPPRPSEPATAVTADADPPRTPRPWDPDRSFADDLDLDAVLARRRAVND